MSYLLDTNILSETVKTKPNKNMIAWLEEVPSENLFISVLTLGELRKGIEKLETGMKKNKLLLWLDNDLTMWFEDRILPVDSTVANRWGKITASNSRTLPAIDALFAATALAHNLIMVTRNGKDFDVSGLEIMNPFDRAFHLA